MAEHPERSDAIGTWHVYGRLSVALQGGMYYNRNATIINSD
jgi:hypothetical protein